MNKLWHTYTVEHHTAIQKEWMIATHKKEMNLVGAT